MLDGGFMVYFYGFFAIVMIVYAAIAFKNNNIGTLAFCVFFAFYDLYFMIGELK